MIIEAGGVGGGYWASAVFVADTNTKSTTKTVTVLTLNFLAFNILIPLSLTRVSLKPWIVKSNFGLHGL